MTIKGTIKEGAGYAEEELFEHGKSAKSRQKAAEGRALREEGRQENGKGKMITPPGTGN